MIASPAIIVNVLNAPQWIRQPLAPWGYWYQDRGWQREGGQAVERRQLAARLSLPEMVLAAWEFRCNQRARR